MKQAIMVCLLLLCFTLTSCDASRKSTPNAVEEISQVSPSTVADVITPSEEIPSDVIPSAEIPSGEILSADFIDKAPYIKAYTDFFLNCDIDEGHDFPIRGYLLFDMDFDNIPELGVFHDSTGSMGGYFTYYRFNGEEIVPILDNEDSPARCSNYTQVLADFENKKVYFLKEMYLLGGNENGTYGYVRELIIQDGAPCVNYILDLEVDQESDVVKHYGNNHIYEDEYLSDTELDECLITQYYFDGGWKDISSQEYLRQKRELIPAENTFVDIRLTDVWHLWPSEKMFDDISFISKNIRLTSAEIDTLFSKWLEYIA